MFFNINVYLLCLCIIDFVGVCEKMYWVRIGAL